MSPCFCVAVLALFALTAASDPDCGELIKTLENRTEVFGRTFLYAATSECEDKLQQIKTIKNSWMELVPEGDRILYHGDKMDGKCYYGNASATYDGNVTRGMFHFNSSSYKYSGKHLVLCPECVLWLEQGPEDGCRSIYLYTRSGGLDEADQVIFKKQLKCLNFTLDLHLAASKDFCPYEKTGPTNVK